MKKKFLIIAVVLYLLICPTFVFAEEPLNPEETVNNTMSGRADALITIGDGIYGDGEGVNQKPIPELVGAYIKVFLALLGVALTMIIVFAGYLWLTAGGSEEQVKKARAWITNGIVGMIITMSAYAITDYVISRLV